MALRWRTNRRPHGPASPYAHRRIGALRRPLSPLTAAAPGAAAARAMLTRGPAVALRSLGHGRPRHALGARLPGAGLAAPVRRLHGARQLGALHVLLPALLHPPRAPGAPPLSAARARQILATSAALEDRVQRGVLAAASRAARAAVEALRRALAAFWRALRLGARTVEFPVRLLGFLGCVMAALNEEKRAGGTASNASERLWDCAVRIAASMGPTFIKLLQWSTTRRDLYSVSFCDHIARLQHSAQPPGRRARKQAERALADAYGPHWRRFLRLEEQIGAGCIASVYRARLDAEQARAQGVALPASLHGDDVVAAVKVLRPGSAELVQLDLQLLEWALALAHRLVPAGVGLDLWGADDLLADFKRMMHDQLDLRVEARNMRVFRENHLRCAEELREARSPLQERVLLQLWDAYEAAVALVKRAKRASGVLGPVDAALTLEETGDAERGRPIDISSGAWERRLGAAARFTVPQMYSSPTAELLVEEFCEGVLLADFLRGRERAVFERAALEKAGGVNALLRRKHREDHEADERLARELGQIGMHGFLRMLFDDNFVHGDLHPGNMIVSVEEDGTVKLALLDGGIVTTLGDADMWNLIDLFYHVGTGKCDGAGRIFLQNAASNTSADPEAFAHQWGLLADKLIQDSFQTSTGEIGALVDGLLDLCREHRVKLDPAFSKVIVAIVVVEGLGKSLDESLDIIRVAVPTIARARRRLRLAKLRAAEAEACDRCAGNA